MEQQLLDRQIVATYRKRPFTLQAVQFLFDNRNEVFAFVEATPAAGKDMDGNPVLYLQTPSGPDMARLGDWIVRLEDGRYYVFTPAQFHANYEQV